ncbi:MAG: glycerate kinase [Desulfobacteraceae bacterium]|nr:glycerate kinase [Desulfobacteraceae bacterium]
MRKDAMEIFQSGLKAVSAFDAVGRHLRRTNEKLYIADKVFDLRHVNRIIVIGAGKATAAMAQAVEQILGKRISDGLISVKYGHGLPLKYIRTIEAGHPIPDQNGMKAARQMLDMVKNTSAHDLVLVLLSGGGSALMPLPVESITLEEKQTLSDLLIGCGATIHQINAVRKHISAIKGGKLAQAVLPSSLVTLIISDVVGDDLDVIASGPTVPDRSTYHQCRQITDHYNITRDLPKSVQKHIENGLKKQFPETPKVSSANWSHVSNVIIANNYQAILAASQKAGKKGYRNLILSSRIEGETRIVAQVHGAIAREAATTGNPAPPPLCLLSGGETTVTVGNGGCGGRNQEFALAAALDIQGVEKIVVLSAGTDGTDGPTDAAGAIADHTTVQRSQKAGLEPFEHLNHHNAYPFFKKLDDLLITGPSQTNVMDLRIILVR